MLELNSPRKQKINLADYDSQNDIENRIVLSDLSPFEVRVLEEILFSSLTIPLKKLAKNLCAGEEDLFLILGKLVKTGLLSVQGDSIVVDKERRKYFEFQIRRFDAEFRPDLEFVQELLRKVPIHVLPTWYAIPRSSNNIFESIVEKYLLTPQLFKRHLQDLQRSDATLKGILQDLYAAPGFQLSSSDLIAKYNLSRRAFEEAMLLLEYNFACTVRYIQEDDHWNEVIVPFYEWHQYILFLQETETPTLEESEVCCKHKEDFAFIEGLPAENKGVEWLSVENRALALYRHPTNPQHVREAEKSICRVLHGKWVAFDEFIKGVVVPLNEEPLPALKKFGKQWKYVLPSYSDLDKQVIKASIFGLLFECGMVAVGVTRDGRDCFRVTSFGRYFFEK